MFVFSIHKNANIAPLLVAFSTENFITDKRIDIYRMKTISESYYLTHN